MKKALQCFFLLLGCTTLSSALWAQDSLIPAFKLEANPITLHLTARPGTPFDKVGRKFAILADESGSFEAWAYPLKLVRNFEFSFFVGSSTRPIPGRDIVRTIAVSPEATVLTYSYQSFTVKAIYITPINDPGGIILLDVRSTEPLTVVCGFLPVLQPMWPAGLGGQYAYWDKTLKAYILSESSGKNHGILGSRLASGISYTPAHMLSDIPNEFKIEIPDPEAVRGKFIPIGIAGGKGRREDVQKVYQNLLDNPEKFYRENVDHFQRLQENTLRIHTPDPKLNLAFEWAKVAFDNLVVDNPDLGKGLVAGLGPSGTSGRPGFGWFFSGDTYINAFSLISCGDFQTVRETLAFTQKWQRNDGKMSHELSQGAGYIDWWNDYPYGYIHGDTTPYYIAAVCDYAEASGDVEFVLESWDSLKKAYAWCLSTDTNADGLMDNKKAGLGALEYGALTGIETDIYLAAVWARAAWAMERLAQIAGDTVLAEEASQNYLKAKQAFDEKFWDETSRFYSYAFNSSGGHVREISPWNAVGLMWNLGTPERSLQSLKKICSSELTTDWGVRSISLHSQYFQPLNYNYGAVWPFLASWVTTALYTHHMPLQGFSLLSSTAAHTFDNALGCITEVFSGTQNIWPQEAVPHQGFSSAGVVLPFVRGLLGLQGNALRKSITFTPNLPADWAHVRIDNYKVGDAAFSFDVTRQKDRLSVSLHAKNAQGYALNFAPALGRGSRILAVRANGEAVEYEAAESGQVIQPTAEIPLKEDSILLEVDFVPSLEILPFIPETETGDENRDLKIVSVDWEGSQMHISVEGLAGEEYRLAVLNPQVIKNVEGATLENGGLRFQMPSGQPGEFIPLKIIVRLRSSKE